MIFFLAPEIPCPIKVDSITPTSVTLSWNHRTHRGLVDGYVIEIDPRDGTEIDPENAMEKGRGFINLTPGTSVKKKMNSVKYVRRNENLCPIFVFNFSYKQGEKFKQCS